MKRQGADDRALEWETGPAAEALEKFKTDKIHASILAKVGHACIMHLRGMPLSVFELCVGWSLRLERDTWARKMPCSNVT